MTLKLLEKKRSALNLRTLLFNLLAIIRKLAMTP